MSKFHFTYENLKSQLKAGIDQGYEFIKCEDYINFKLHKTKRKIVVLRIDIDFSVKKALLLCNIFNELGIKGSFFLRLHAPEYNPFSFENYRIIKYIIKSGHEIGYHSEIIDQAEIWNEDAELCLTRDIDIINRIFNIKIKGVASHGGNTGLNNLDFWENRLPEDFGLLYEGYDKEDYNLFQEAFYISDSEWVQWKCYDKGKLVEGDRRSFGEHINDNHKLIHLLIHPDTYFNNNFYENEK
jgi:hypothetical protein